MGSKWKKIKTLLRSRSCALPPSRHGALLDEDYTAQNADDERVAGAHCKHPPKIRARGLARGLSLNELSTGPLIIVDTYDVRSPSVAKIPVTSASGPIPVGSSQSQSLCPICLESMKPGQGQALFTAECSHIFHFSCIVSSVRHGNQFCPICRGKWKDLPWQGGSERSESQDFSRSSSLLSSEATNADNSQNSPDSRDGHGSIGRQFSTLLRSFNFVRHSSSSSSSNVHGTPNFSAQNTDNRPSNGEPDYYNDDEPLHQSRLSDVGPRQKLHLRSFPEVSAVPLSEDRQCFTVLVNMKAPASGIVHTAGTFVSNPHANSRIPVDLVAVLDVSGSMSGIKILLLKQAMSFVIRNLGSADRLSIVVFSSGAKRILPLRRMGEDGQRQALQVVDAIRAGGGTNIAEGLQKGVNVLDECLQSNPVSSIILLSDGQDTYRENSRRRHLLGLSQQNSAMQRLLPPSIRCRERSDWKQIPIHTFGFGSDHDGEALYAISEMSGGIFSYVQAEEMVQDAFAQCIGGLLSVVAQDVQLKVTCPTPSVRIRAIQSGSYENSILENSCQGIVKLGDLYAEEERDVLVDLTISALSTSAECVNVCILQAECIYKDPFKQEVMQSSSDELSIKRPVAAEEHQQFSLEVDRQRNRLLTANAITEAGMSADWGDIEAAQSGIRKARAQLEVSVSAHAGDQLYCSLDAELSKVEERMANMQLYKEEGRSYCFSAQSSHMRQRASVRGDSMDLSVSDYQTPSMIDMVTLSQSNSTLEARGGGFDRAKSLHKL